MGRIGRSVMTALLALAAIGAAPGDSATLGNATGNDAANALAESANTTNESTIVERRERTVVANEAAGTESPEVAALRGLMLLFVLAVLLENALAPLFNWRVFQSRYDARGVRMPITVVAAAILVAATDPGIVARILTAYSSTPATPLANNLALRALETLVIAGGSAGVHRLMIALGLRAPAPLAADLPKPPPTKAWLSVALLRRSADGPVTVEIDQGDGRGFLIAGTIKGGLKGARRRPASIQTALLRNDDRLPQSGGLTIDPAQTITVRLSATAIGADGAVTRIESRPWGPHRLREGAIVDIDMEL